MWKVSWLYEKVHNIANFGGYATILKRAFPLYSTILEHWTIFNGPFGLYHEGVDDVLSLIKYT